MRDHFTTVSEHLVGRARPGEVLLATFGGERSDFMRLNGGRVRQAGSVEQRSWGVDLIEGRRHAFGSVTTTGDPETDLPRLTELVDELRAVRPHLPEDPHLLYATDPGEITRDELSRLPDGTEAARAILDHASDLDLVGILSCGSIHRGFASSLGRRGWHTTHPFHFDWSVHLEGDRAVKSAYSGFDWDETHLAQALERATRQREILARPRRTIAPGGYRVYLSPTALYEILVLLAWDGFGVRALRTKTTPLLAMLEGRERLSPQITILENTAEGVAPAFDDAGFLRPDVVPLVRAGLLGDPLVSPRSAVEYGLDTNGAASHEAPMSWDVGAGELEADRILDSIGTGIYVSNLWYLSFSDRAAGRITGMTRFATFWVEDGEIRAPLEVMRFDETVFRMLGENLVGLTAEREMLLDGDTYERRSVESARLPGALIDDFRLVA